MYNKVRWSWFEAHSSTLFFGAGLSMLAAISISLLRDTAWFWSPNWLHNLLGPLGVVLTAYALLAFYPWVADASPRLARVGLAVAMFAAGAISVGFVGAIVAAALTDTTITNPPGWVPPLYFSTIASLSVGFLLYGVAALRTRVPSLAVGISMLAPSVLLFGLFVGETTMELHPYLPRVFALVTPGYLLFLGYTVRAGSAEADRRESPTESPA